MRVKPKTCETCVWGTDSNQTRILCHLRAPAMHYKSAAEASGDAGKYWVSGYSHNHDTYGRPVMERDDFCGEWKARR